ncbi:ArsR/SmtB family transcription factor [Mycolicibacterium stellerae]|uniref:ArsR/SmtB family transcription factor n=1 Tax=Mycolicibacterium stellerae TaxID=2358193 RepID=UPI0019D127F9|nr:metalloregulator ArsR/SmtB family transcription factor [Mycolicibacterium stellerae]
MVFKALADPGRRLLLDRLRKDNGQTLGQLCEYLEMARQSVSQHLAVLESANLISSVRRGRLKLHYLNPVPLQEITYRWIQEFEHQRLHALRALKRQAEEAEMAATDGKPSFVYVTYIHSTPEKVWEALTDADLTADYWGHSNVSDWQPGSRWEHRRTDGSGIADVVGEVIEATPPHRLVMTFGGSDESGAPSVVRFDIEPHHDIVRLTVTHDGLTDPSDLRAVSAGWPAVLSNLKSLLETGRVLPQAPWEMHEDIRAEQMSRNG